MLGKKFQILLIATVILVLYYISINQNINSIDDKKLFNTLLNQDTINLKHLFFPQYGSYYRPICILTYKIDRILWLIEASFYHLENILIHIINSFLVFFITLKMFKDKNAYLPLFAALIFGVHPINTEAVNWISARCDLLAAMFSLVSFLIILYSYNTKYRFLWLLVCCFIAFFGSLSKEVGVAFYVAGLFWVLFVENNQIKKKISYALIFLGFLVFYFYLRHIALVGHDGSTTRVIKFTEHHNYYKILLIFVQALGFYVKKLIVPFPLNFGIIHVSKLYLYVGFVIVLFDLIKLFRMAKVAGVFVISNIFILPALFVALGNVAWTPYAERYIYTASAFFSISAVSFVFYILSKIKITKKVFFYFMICLIIFYSIATFNRNRTWTSNLYLYKDTIEKSPDFIVARNEYANALLELGYKNKAKEQYKIAASINKKSRLKSLPELNLIISDNISLESKKRQLYEIYKNNDLKRLNNSIIHKIIRINFKMMDNVTEEEKIHLLKENASLFEKLYKNTKNGFYLYKTAQMYIALKAYKKAEKYLRKAKTYLNKKSIYYRSADKLLKEIKNFEK